MHEWLRRTIFIAKTVGHRESKKCLAINLFFPIVQIFGISSVLPFIYVVMNPNQIQQNSILRFAHGKLGLATNQQFLIGLGVLTLIALSVSNVFSLYVESYNRKFSSLIQRRLSKKLFLKSLQQNYEEFVFQSFEQLRQNIIFHSGSVAQFWVLGLIKLSGQFVTIGIIVVALLVIDPYGALFSCGFFVIFFGVVYGIVRKRLRTLGQVAIVNSRRIAKVISESHRSFKDIRLRSAEGYFSEKLDDVLKEQGKVHVEQHFMTQLPNHLVEVVIFTVAVAMTMYFLIRSNDVGHVVPMIGLYAAASIRLLPALKSSFVALTNCRFNLLNLRSVSDNLSENIEQIEYRENIIPLQVKNHFTLHQVNYKYPSTDKPVLNDLNLTVKVGQTIGIIGLSGSGKSSLLNVLTGILDPQSGYLSVDGNKLNKFSIPAWQAALGYVSQDVVIFNDSVEQNIAYCEEVDKERVRWAGRIALVDDFLVNEKSGYDTVLGENGMTISGGQRQRIALARAIYRKPQILILDEATSSLDLQTESTFLRNLASTAEIRTVIIVTHRSSSLQLCDAVYTMNGDSIDSVAEQLSSTPLIATIASGPVFL